MANKLILGMDIGGTNMRFGLVDERYCLAHFVIEPTQEVFCCADPMDMIKERIRTYCDEHLDGKLPDAISMGFPSTIDKTRRIVTSTPNVRALQNIAVADFMERAFKIPVYINRDVNFLMLYDILHHHLENQKIVLGFYLGTGLGNAISIGGNLLLGKNGVAAELGHIPMLGATDLCGCGNYGCAETVASGVRLEKIQSDLFPDTSIREMFTRHRDEPAMLEFIDGLSIPIATEVNIFDPDYVIIGGGIPQMPDFPMQYLEEFIHRHLRKPYPALNLEILYSIPKQENGVIGAGIYAFKRLESEDYR